MSAGNRLQSELLKINPARPALAGVINLSGSSPRVLEHEPQSCSTSSAGPPDQPCWMLADPAPGQLGAGRSGPPGWTGCRVPSSLPLVGIPTAIPAGLELSFTWKRLAWARGTEVSCFWRACFFLGIPTSCVLWHSAGDGSEMLKHL